MSEFQTMCGAVVKDGGFDCTGALAVADYLQERDDARGVRLRRRVQMYERFLYRVSRNALGWHDALCELKKRTELENVISYFFRLLSVSADEPLPRWTLGGAWWVVEPGENGPTFSENEEYRRKVFKKEGVA